MGRARLTADERRVALVELQGWTLVEGRDAIAKSFKFKDFSQAFGWMTRVALKAEQLDHHPEWKNVWNRVDVVLTTHSAKGLTELDVALAKHCDAVAAEARAFSDQVASRLVEENATNQQPRAPI